MKNLKAHHHLTIASMLLFGVTAVWAWGSIVFAGSSNTTINVYVGPPDACQNIAGYQTEVPSGMLVDGSGNCYTPPPPPVDVCANMAGIQETIPEGHYRDSSGNCLPQPTPPKDVCPNLAGIQESVPAGYVINASGNCVLPPNDMCSNIEGVQILVPQGMEVSATGVCFTPTPDIPAPIQPTTPPENPWVTPTTPRTPRPSRGAPKYKNVPVVLESAVEPIVAAIPEDVKEALRSVPPVVARTFPYFTFLILLLAAAIMAWQATNEIIATKKLMALIKRERDVAEEKDNFISLASHYLRTPLTIMKGAIDTSRAINELTDETAAPLRAAMAQLDEQIGVVLADVESNAALKDITPPKQEPPEKTSFLRSAYFWIPVIAAIVIVWLSNFLLGVVGEVELGTYNLITQAGVYIGVSLMFYSAIRTRFIKRRERGYRETLLKHEHTIDYARNNFIAGASAALANGLINIASQRGVMSGSKAENLFNDGFDRFDHLLSKFNLLSEIQAGVSGATEQFDIKVAIEDIIRFYQPQLEANKLTIINRIESTSIKQRRSLFDFVLGSLIDNAIKFSNEGGTITISSDPHENSLTVNVSDHGIGIPEEKMSQLFKPFSRGTSAMEFNYEGLGFSLFLDKIIMDYVGGKIAAESVTNSNTTFSVTTDVA